MIFAHSLLVNPNIMQANVNWVVLLLIGLCCCQLSCAIVNWIALLSIRLSYCQLGCTIVNWVVLLSMHLLKVVEVAS